MKNQKTKAKPKTKNKKNRAKEKHSDLLTDMKSLIKVQKWESWYVR